MVANTRRTRLTSAALLSLLAAAGGISFIRRRHGYAIPSTSSFKQRQDLLLDTRCFFRGGAIADESDELNAEPEAAELDPHQNLDEGTSVNADENGGAANQDTKSFCDNVWEEEIKRLQTYLNSPESRQGSRMASPQHELQSGESSNAFGAGEDVHVFGSGSSIQVEDDAHRPHKSTALDNHEQDVVIEEDETMVNPLLIEEQNNTSNEDNDEYGNDVSTVSPEDANKDIEINDDPDASVELLDVGEETVSDGEGEEKPIDGEQVAEITETTSSYEEVQEVVDDAKLITQHASTEAMPQQVQTQIITEHSSIIPSEDSNINEDLMPDTSTINQWKAASTIAESNKLVEEGLNKLRRKDGDHPSVPYVITRAMKRVLIEELGYDQEEVKVMRPDVAVVIVSENLCRPSITTLPSRFYNEDSIEPVHQIESISEMMRRRVHVLVRKFDLKQTLVMLGSAVASYSLISVFKNTKEDQLVYESREAVKDVDVTTVHEIEGDDEPRESEANTIPTNDLDRTWLDRLISMLTFYK